MLLDDTATQIPDQREAYGLQLHYEDIICFIILLLAGDQKGGSLL